MKILRFCIVSSLLYCLACNSKPASSEASTAGQTTASVDQDTAGSTYELGDKGGVFMLVKAKPGMKDKMMQNMAKTVETMKKTTGPDVFIVHTFPNEPDMAYVYVLSDRDAENKNIDPLVDQLKRESSTYIASTTLYPLNAMFGKLPQ